MATGVMTDVAQGTQEEAKITTIQCALEQDTTIADCIRWSGVHGTYGILFKYVRQCDALPCKR